MVVAVSDRPRKGRFNGYLGKILETNENKNNILETNENEQNIEYNSTMPKIKKKR